jgi:hypothetical protein
MQKKKIGKLKKKVILEKKRKKKEKVSQKKKGMNCGLLSRNNDFPVPFRYC